MPNLSSNITKYIVSKLLSIAEIGVYVGVLLLLALRFRIFDLGTWWAIAIILVCLLVLWLLFSIVYKKMDDWKVPELVGRDKKVYLLLGTAWSVIFLAVFSVILFPYINHYLLFGSFGLVLLFTEYRKWKEFVPIEVIDDEKTVEAEIINEKKADDGIEFVDNDLDITDLALDGKMPKDADMEGQEDSDDDKSGSPPISNSESKAGGLTEGKK